MNIFKFENISDINDDDQTVSINRVVNCEDNALTWKELVWEFYDFVKACGYSVKEDDYEKTINDVFKK